VNVFAAGLIVPPDSYGIAYTVPVDKYFVLTTITGMADQVVDLIEERGGTMTIKMGYASFYSFGNYQPVLSSGQLGLVFAPGSNVMLHNLIPNQPASFSFTFIGYLTQ